MSILGNAETSRYQQKQLDKTDRQVRLDVSRHELRESVASDPSM